MERLLQNISKMSEKTMFGEKAWKKYIKGMMADGEVGLQFKRQEGMIVGFRRMIRGIKMRECIRV